MVEKQIVVMIRRVSLSWTVSESSGGWKPNTEAKPKITWEPSA